MARRSSSSNHNDDDATRDRKTPSASKARSKTVRQPLRPGRLIEFLKLQKQTEFVVNIGSSPIRVSLKNIKPNKLATKLATRGILAPEVMAERAMLGVDFSKEAKVLGLNVNQVAALYQASLERLDPIVRMDIERAVAHPKGLGQIDPRDPDYPLLRKLLKIDQIRIVDLKELLKWRESPWGRIFLYLGPTDSVDLRPTLGPARDQQARGTCTAFGSTAVMESLEYMTDRRSGTRDLSEELMFWYSKGGQLYTAGGYDCGAALRHYTEYGSCEETYFPYWGTEIYSNHAQVPASDIAMDRAHYFTSDQVAGLPITGNASDISAVKDVIRSGRCVTFSSDAEADTWNTGTGIITFPDPLDSRGRGGSHCTTIIGFIDRNDLPGVNEGGYFIVRNSWGGAGSTSNMMGPEYGGHLLMPYGWYRRYVSSAYTLVDQDHLLTQGRRWIAEYFPNRSLQGVGISGLTMPPFFNTHGTILEGEVDQIDFDWGNDGPFRLVSTFPGFPTLNLGPSDNFSARYTQIRRFRPGWYRFKLRGDDGVRLWVDDQLVINQWRDQATTQYTEEYYLTGGDHILRVEYYEHTGLARVRLQIEPIMFHYELFASNDLSGTVYRTFDDTSTELEWRHAPPVRTGTSNGEFSLRAAGRKYFAAGTYRFHALHTGGCRIWIGKTLVLDDWDGLNPTGNPVSLTGGNKNVSVEFRNLARLPAAGEKGYYRAALSFGWSDEGWQTSIHYDPKRKAIHDSNYPHIDSLYEAFRTESLSGAAVFEYRYPATNNIANQYFAQDGLPLILQFSNLDKFKTGIPGSGAIPNDWLSAHIRRRVFINEAGNYIFRLSTDDGYRLIVDGKQILQDHHIRGSDPFNVELNLERGIHEIAIEYANTKWGGSVYFKMERAAWQVNYYSGTNFETLRSTQNIDRVDKIIESRPASVGSSNYSLRARRTMWLPLGRYRVQVRSDDGVRLKIAGLNLIDSWTNQSPTSYWNYFEHRGGQVPIEIEYFQSGGGALLEFNLIAEGFLGEYYRGVALEKPASGAALDRNVPIAYRFEPVINFDWGNSGPLPRIGANVFSARWNGSVSLPVGRWALDVRADDGIRLFLDGRLLIDQWRDQSATTYTKVVDLVGRKHDIRLEYYEKTGSAVCSLFFRRLN